MLCLFCPLFLWGKKASITLHGQSTSSLNFRHARAYTSQYHRFAWGWEEYANLRMKTKVGDFLTLYLSFNIFMFSGTYTDVYKIQYIQQAASMKQQEDAPDFESRAYFYQIPFYYKSSYIGAFELDRFYLDIGNDYFAFQAGLMRIARGFGYIFSPTDLFNPRHPVNPQARQEGRLALRSQWYPADFLRLELFSIAPDNPVEQSAWGMKHGFAANFYLGKVNFETLYTFLLPEMDYLQDQAELGFASYTNNDFAHIAGFSLKADIEAGLFVDMIYRFEHRWFKKGYYGRRYYGYEGLEAALGIDYTIKGKVYLLAEYLFYGPGLADWMAYHYNAFLTPGWHEVYPAGRSVYLIAEKKPMTYNRHHYLFGMFYVKKVNDYIPRLGASYMFGIEDQSGLLNVFMDIEPFQACTITLSALYPFDWNMVNRDWGYGEFGPVFLGFHQDYKVSVAVKF